jgi:hypothetical protein
MTAWLLLLGWFTARRNEAQTPGDGVLALCLIALTCWGATTAIASLARRVLRTPAMAPAQSVPEPHSEPGDVVTQCLSVPPAPDRAGHHVRDLLPDYARDLLTRSRESLSPPTPHHPNTESEQSQ